MFQKLSIFVAFAFFLFAPLSADGQKVRLRSQITPNCGSASDLRFADIYADGNLAVMGSFSCRGAFIFDVSNPDDPVLLSWYNPGNNQQFLEAIVVGNRGYFGSGNGGGVHIVDLTNPTKPTLLGVVNSSNGNGYNSIHEMMVHGYNGVAYLIQNSNFTSQKLIKIINVSEPATPVHIHDLAVTEVNWVHAMHIRGERMYTSGWGSGTSRAKTEIYDISNLGMQMPTLLGSIIDPSGAVTAGNNMHSSWTSEDGRYLYSAREVTNSNGAHPGDLRVYDVLDPANPMLIKRIGMADLQLNAVTPHNPVVMGNKLYVSWYQAGLQVFDITNPEDPKHIGQYDTYQRAFAPSEAEDVAAADEPWDVMCGRDSMQNPLPTTYNGAWAVFPFLGEDRVLIGDLTSGLITVDVTEASSPLKNQVSDFDGDGITDHAVYNPSTGMWYAERSSDQQLVTRHWGIEGDIIVPGDFDGDGKSDFAIWRPSTGRWWVWYESGGIHSFHWGVEGDIPVPADYDADGKTDFAIWRPSTGMWWVASSTLGIQAMHWGVAGDIPITGDYDGDGKADFGIWRPSTGMWWIMRSSSSIPINRHWGEVGDMPVAADFNGDGRTDVAIWRPSSGMWWIIFDNFDIWARHFGIEGDVPIPADFDGDGKADISVFRPSTNVWYRLNSGDGAFIGREFGAAGDIPSPASSQPQ